MLFQNHPKRAIALIAIQFALAIAVTQWIFPHYRTWHGFDLQHYHTLSVFVRDGLVPYRDFQLEYPPLSLIPIVLPQWFSPDAPLGSVDYALGFVAENWAIAVLLALGLLGIAPRRSLTSLCFYSLLVLLISPLLPWRYDLFPTLLTLGSLLSAIAGFPLLCGISLGLGIAAKLYPVVLLPVFVLYCLARRQTRAAWTTALAAIGATIVSFAPFWWLAGDRFTSFLTYHKDRGLQIESLYAGLVSLGHLLGLTEAQSEMNYGAQHLVSPLAEPLLLLQPFLFVTTMAIVYVLAWWRFRQEARDATEISTPALVAYCTAALLGFALTNKVFSPQYLIWLLPFLPLLPGRFVGVASLSFALTTTVSFVTRQLRLMYPPSVLMLNLRNALLLGLLVWLLLAYLPERRDS